MQMISTNYICKNFMVIYYSVDLSFAFDDYLVLEALD